jgi:ribosomal protein S18 acetylase RimI-like enzyme
VAAAARTTATSSRSAARAERLHEGERSGETHITRSRKAQVPDIDIRWARREEAGEIARLFLISSDELAAYIWNWLDMAGLSPEEIGTARHTRTGAVFFSYENALVAVAEDGIAGMVHAFEVKADDASEEDDAVARPYAELSDPGSLYVSGLAVHARHRGRGIGGELMDCVHELALAKGLPRISLICFDRNERALAFCRRRSFCEAMRRTIVPHLSLRCRQSNALLLTRAVGSNPRHT